MNSDTADQGSEPTFDNSQGIDEPGRKYEESRDKRTTDRLWNDFTYHAPKDGQVDRYAYIRARLQDVAFSLTDHCPASRELSCALTHLEEAMFYANAAIARNE